MQSPCVCGRVGNATAAGNGGGGGTECTALVAPPGFACRYLDMLRLMDSFCVSENEGELDGNLAVREVVGKGCAAASPF